jgi:two-component sensor histidine kinase/ABC-type multidrug transport system ATPase subunit
MDGLIFQIKNLKSSNFKGCATSYMDLDLKAGEVHAVVGGNDFITRAFIEAVSAQEKNVEGRVIFKGVELDISQVGKLKEVAFLFHKPMLVECMSVAENIVLDNFPRRRILPFVHWGKVRENTKFLLRKLNFQVDHRLKVSKLSNEEKRLVSIAKAFYSNPKCIIMYNPTKHLSSEAVLNLYKVIDNYKNDGNGIIYITKQWEEALKIADKISVIDEGEIKKIFTADEAKKSPQELLNMLNKFSNRNSEAKIDNESRQVLDATFRAAEFLTSEYELNDILRLLSEQVTKFMNADGCNIHLIDEGTNTVIDTLEFKVKEELQATLKDELALSVAKKKKMFYSNRNEKDFLSNFKINNGVKTIICVPVLIRSRVTGIIQIYYERLYANSEEETKTLSAFARHAALAIEDTRLMGRSALLQESHHRIKNNLQSIINIIALQKQVGVLGDESNLNDVLDNIISRVRSIAYVHDLLAKDKLGRSIINIKEIVKILSNFFSSMNTELVIDLDLDDVFIPYNKATSIALIINELISNCLKHAFPDKKAGLIRIKCKKTEEFVLLCIEDNGVGIAPDFDKNKRSSLGISIISSIIKYEFKGKIDFISKEKGTKVEINLPNEKVFITYMKKNINI